LADWLPDGITINVSDFFSKTEGCSTIDCVRQSLGKICQNGTLAGCLRSAGLICSEKSTNPNCMTVIAAPVDCTKGDEPDCQGTTPPFDNKPAACPDGATCAPESPDPGTQSEVSEDPEGQESPSPPESSGGDETVTPGPTTTTVVEPNDAPATE